MSALFVMLLFLLLCLDVDFNARQLLSLLFLLLLTLLFLLVLAVVMRVATSGQRSIWPHASSVSMKEL